MLIGAALAHIVVIAVDGEDLGGSAAGERDADAQRVDLREDGGVERVLHVDVAAVGRGLGPAGDVEREQSVAAGGLPPAEQRDGRVHGERAVGLLELEDAVLEEGARDGGVQLALEALRVQRVQPDAHARRRGVAHAHRQRALHVHALDQPVARQLHRQLLRRRHLHAARRLRGAARAPARPRPRRPRPRRRQVLLRQQPLRSTPRRAPTCRLAFFAPPSFRPLPRLAAPAALTLTPSLGAHAARDDALDESEPEPAIDEPEPETDEPETDEPETDEPETDESTARTVLATFDTADENSDVKNDRPDAAGWCDFSSRSFCFMISRAWFILLS